MADAPNHDAWRATVRHRLVIVAVIFTIWSVAVQARLLWLQVHDHKRLAALAVRQHERTVTLPAMRGTITDRVGRMVATSADADTVYAVPTEVDDPGSTARKLCAVLDGCSGSKDQYSTLVERLSKNRPFAYVKRQVSPAESAAVVALKLDGVGLRKESRRFYPMRELMSGVLGYVGLDNRGLGGIELKYNSIIRGTDGQALIYIDANRRAYDSVSVPPTAGASLELTIDAALQHAVERELARGVAEHRADSGVAIVMDPWTGEVLAMASVPTFNPNAFGDTKPDHRQNLGVAYTYEPGSTFKTFTASAAIQEGTLTPESPIDCAPGYILIGRRRVNDVHRYGVLSFTDVIIKSSNVGAIKAGLRGGAEQMQRYVRRFGFGTRLTPDLPGEEAGIVWNQLSDSALASVSMGYQIGVTPLQMATAVSSIANGGKLMRPRLVRAFWHGNTRKAVAPEVIRQTVTPETAATLTAIMEGVVERGTAKTAQIEGYAIAAKTGTAAKLDGGAYSKQRYNSSIVGFFPARKPAVTVLVVIDTPRGGAYYGGTVAGPVFKRIAEVAIQHLGLPRSVDPEPKVMLARATSSSVTPVAYGPTTVLSTSAAASRDGVMPDLRGLSARVAVHTLARAGFTPHVAGRGVVTVQDPVAGTALDPGVPVRLWLDRAVPPQPTVSDAQP